MLLILVYNLFFSQSDREYTGKCTLTISCWFQIFDVRWLGYDHQ